MPLFDAFQRLTQRQAITSMLGTTRVELHLPQYGECHAEGCGYDAVLGTALNQVCPVCEGRGRVRNEAVAVLMARVAWLDHQQLGVYMNMPQGEKADVEMQTHLENAELLERVRKTEGAYILIDGKKLVIRSVTPNRIEGLTSLDVRLAMQNEDVLGV